MSWDHRWHRDDAPHGRPNPHRFGHWQPGSGPPAWARHDWHPKRRLFFARFVGFFMIILGLIVGGMAVLAFLLTNYFGGDHSTVLLVWIGGCGLALALPILAVAIGASVFRSYAIPLADIMDAAEAVATGDLEVRVKESGSREFQRLAHSFNRMTEELARTDQQRRNLTADVAHELRTPLHIIQGNLEGILDGVYAPTAEHIDATLQETRTLARLVDDLRTLSLAESGQLPLHLEEVDVHDLLADVATSFGPQAESAGIHLCVDADASVPLTLYGDPGRLDQVLGNLVSNALRHTPPGGSITLGAAAMQTADGSQVQLTVADTGEGIAAKDLPFIFDRFWRADRARTHVGGTGSGLGLAITGQLVKAHGGTITVSSTQGVGTTFSITLPVDASV
jgi:two-component system OmpR family sensor kinase/two-component system sensor histidine kinase BaeS